MIRDQIKTASKVVIVTSPDSAHSQWVNYEASMASALGKPIIAIVPHHGSTGTEFLKGLGDVHAIEIDDVG